MPPSNDTKKSKYSGSILPEAVGAKYEPAEGVLAVFSCPEFGMVDLKVITPEFAERLAQAGYLKKI